MPTLTLKTNVKLFNPKEFILNLSKLGADILKVPERYILVSYSTTSFSRSVKPLIPRSCDEP
ncbi:hypothetical protein BJY52DRAFT_1275580 [Lactarius psammicola]|nr:hypothetical protein BJY52DRAFT_1275580 [Lactarius psammicola]